jgi:hypothetical protein
MDRVRDVLEAHLVAQMDDFAGSAQLCDLRLGGCTRDSTRTARVARGTPQRRSSTGLSRSSTVSRKYEFGEAFRAIIKRIDAAAQAILSSVPVPAAPIEPDVQAAEAFRASMQELIRSLILVQPGRFVPPE